jgi:branched-chain amino acid transport system substrate-binding protein
MRIGSRWIVVPLLVAGCQLVASIDEKQPATSSGPDTSGCASNQECMVKAGGPAICRKPDRTCQPLLTNDCDHLVGSVDDDSTIVFGFIQDLRGPNASTGNARLQSTELAVNEIMQTTRGIPGGPDGRPRPIAFVACSENRDATSPADAKVPGTFLVDTLRVPGILGASNSGSVIDLATRVTIPAGVLLFAPSATSTAITDLPTANPRLVWRTSPSDAIQGVAYRLATSALEAEVHTRLAVDKVKVAVAVKGDAFGIGFWATAQKGMTINGADVAAPENASFVLALQYNPDATTAELATIASKLLDFGPDIVLSIGTAEAVPGILSPVEDGWRALHPSQPPPQWMFTDGVQSDPLLNAAASETSDLRARIRGTVPGSRGPRYDAFLLDYRAAYPNGPTPTFGSAGSYDIVYLLAYAARAAPPGDSPDAPLTGGRLVAGLLNVVTGDRATSEVVVGPDALNGAFQTLGAGNKVKFTGASGPLSFDPSVGEAPSDIDLWCISRTGAPQFRSSGVYYSAEEGKLLGELNCE